MVSGDNKDKVTCNRVSCVNHSDGYCTFKNPERDGVHCLHYEDTMKSLRLRLDLFRGTLKR